MTKQPLQVKTSTQSAKEALNKVKESMNEEYPGYLTRWSAMNMAAGKVFRPGQIYAIAGLSGSGKSFVVNMMREDFANPELNGRLMERKPFKILAFSLEMSSADEILRTISSRMKVSYNDLLSEKEKITENFYAQIKDEAKRVANDVIYYVEDPGDYQQIYDTIEDFALNKFPSYNIVVTIDHTLLLNHAKNESSDNDLVSNIMRVCRLARKRFNALVIPVAQLRDDIEKPERINNPLLHYPKRQDIYSSKKVYMDSDWIGVIHRPSRLGINYYGPRDYPVNFDDGSDLIAFHILKGRLTGKEGWIKFKNQFHKGTMEYIKEL